MSLGNAIRAALTADEQILALVGDGVRPVILSTDDQLPAITYRVVGNKRELTQDGGTADRAGGCTLQVFAWSQDADERETLAELILDHLNGFDDVLEGYELIVLHDDDSDSTPPPENADEIPEFGSQIDFNVLYRRPT